ncbi:MAG: DNA helicase RecQ [Spirochaetales bacterium]|jgi:ATP-dependent DNA helicase RecQ|nr:DNA helicase RecQ [Spirochaetales bacterium]
MPSKNQDKHEVLKTHFGYTLFRPGQESVIDALLAGRDVLAVMPTGAGKSLCYQLPALMMGGLTLVISPLISLMKDQVEALRDSGIPAAYLNSSLPPADYAETLLLAAGGQYRILYIAPERLQREDLLHITETVKISMIVIDEAHCVSHWGHDFRPGYLTIAAFIRQFPARPVIAAFTATATSSVKEDVALMLDLREPYMLTTGFNRENLYFEVQRPKDKRQDLLRCLENRRDKSGIIYCATRKGVEEICAILNQNGFAATRYHAGLDDRERQENQDDFIYDRKQVMVATNAFGMGIDKSNVSFVIHYNMPKNIESYYQEAGRAGRDGEKADCILLYSPQDVNLNKFFITRAQDEYREKTAALQDSSDFASGEFKDDYINHNLELLKHMTFYAVTTDCLRAYILKYFGEASPHYCGNCSNCTTVFESVDITLPAQKIISCVFRVEQRGRRFGKGMIVNILKGSKSEKLTGPGLETLSTYGIMADTDARRIRLILDQLIAQGYLAVSDGEYPVVCPSPRSGEIIFDKKPVAMMLPKETRKQQSAIFPETPFSDFDAGLLTKLKDLRRRLAKEAHVPAYIIFPDATLQDMCRKRPGSREEFLEVSGVGIVKMKKYGGEFTKLIRQHTGGI